MTGIADEIRRAFADLTGVLEDAAMIAARGQSARTRAAARKRTVRLAKLFRQMAALLDGIEERLQ